MSNKKETPVRWLEGQLFNKFGQFTRGDIQHALQLESQKQQKYDEMLGMLEDLQTNNNKHDNV
jgi:hypothetical protein